MKIVPGLHGMWQGLPSFCGLRGMLYDKKQKPGNAGNQQKAF